MFGRLLKRNQAQPVQPAPQPLPTIDEVCEDKCAEPQEDGPVIMFTDEQVKMMCEAIESGTMPLAMAREAMRAFLQQWYGMPCVDVNVDEDWGNANDKFVHIHARFRRTLQ